MKISKNLDTAIKVDIKKNPTEYIDFGEWEPSLKALRNTARLINAYQDLSSAYESLASDPIIGSELYLLAFDKDYHDPTALRSRLRRVLVMEAGEVLKNYQQYAWDVLDAKNPAAVER